MDFAVHVFVGLANGSGFVSQGLLSTVVSDVRFTFGSGCYFGIAARWTTFDCSSRVV